MMKLYKNKNDILGLILIFIYLICVILLTVYIFKKTLIEEDFLNSYIRFLFIAFVPVALLLVYSEKLADYLNVSYKVKELIPLSLFAILSVPFISGLIAWLLYLLGLGIVLIAAFWKIILIGLGILMILIFGSLLKDKVIK